MTLGEAVHIPDMCKPRPRPVRQLVLQQTGAALLTLDRAHGAKPQTNPRTDCWPGQNQVKRGVKDPQTHLDTHKKKLTVATKTAVLHRRYRLHTHTHRWLNKNKNLLFQNVLFFLPLKRNTFTCSLLVLVVLS